MQFIFLSYMSLHFNTVFPIVCFVFRDWADYNLIASASLCNRLHFPSSCSWTHHTVPLFLLSWKHTCTRRHARTHTRTHTSGYKCNSLVWSRPPIHLFSSKGLWSWYVFTYLFTLSLFSSNYGWWSDLCACIYLYAFLPLLNYTTISNPGPENWSDVIWWFYCS